MAGSRVVVEVRDNGVGFDPAASIGGFGTVYSIRQRMADAGGRAEIVSAPGQHRDDRELAGLHPATATVYSHLERIRDKTGARRRAQLTRLYLEDHGKGKA